MRTVKVNNYSEIPKNHTGIVEYLNGEKEWYKNNLLHREDGPAIECLDGSKYWYKEGKAHRIDGPAIENYDGYKEWCLEGKIYYRINLKNYIVLDYYKGKYNFMWYNLLGKDEIFEYPDIPGLIEK